MPFSADDTVFTDESGQQYFFSEGTNHPLCRAQYSFWAYIGGILHQEGVEIPDLVEMLRWNAGLVGHPEYGIPRYAPGTGVSATPRELLALWPAAQYMVTQALIRPAEWPMAYGIAAQHMLNMAKGQFDLTTLARITFESANGMSKLAIPVTPADLEVASS